tara:strand:+ start:1194 stop:1544 length:351 start_codon:yes stop_codon:yes gene_type:complete
MPTHAEMANKLLISGAQFFRDFAEKFGEQDPKMSAQMLENADVFEQLATLIEGNPTGELNGTPVGTLAGKVLKDAAIFFYSLGEQNEPIKEQMVENANVYNQIGDLVSEDPMGILD